MRYSLYKLDGLGGWDVVRCDGDTLTNTEIVRRLNQQDAEIERLTKLSGHLSRLTHSLDALLACYRLGRRPPERLLDAIMECRKQAEALDQGTDSRDSGGEEE